MDKKIGIITFSRAQNYGSVLQAYALQMKVQELFGIRCEIIDFMPPNQEDMYKIFVKNNSVKNVVVNMAALFYYSTLKERGKAFERFLQNRLNMSEKKYDTKASFIDIDERYQLCISGGDQIWNVNIKDFSMAYFFPNAKKAKKISYAPSLGGGGFDNIKSEKLNKIKKALLEYDKVSVREFRGQEAIEELIEKEVERVIDPTFLLDKKEWDKIASARLYQEDYIFYYSINYDEDITKMVKKISKKLNMKVIIMYTSRKTCKTIMSGFEMTKGHSPEDFISLVKYAKLVLTNSFHGTAFAAIYHKPFYNLRLEKAKSIDFDNRITTIQNVLGLKNREIYPSNIDDIKIEITMDYDDIGKNMKNEQEKGIRYLKEAENWLR